MNRTMRLMQGYKLLPGYAEQSSKRNPKEPETVIVGEKECAAARCVGSAMIYGRLDWLVFKIPGKRRYYFQIRTW